MHYKYKPNYKKLSVNHGQLIPFFNRKNKADNDQGKHWLSGKNSLFFAENHITLKSNQQPMQRYNPTNFSDSLVNEMHFS